MQGQPDGPQLPDPATDPTADPTADTPDTGARLVHVLRSLTVRLDLLGAEFAARNRLHPTDLRALICLLDAARAGTTATPGLLGERLGLNSASVTGLVDRLERLGLVERVRDDRDRRRVRLVVHERAVTLGGAFFGPLIGDIAGVAASFDTTELAAVERFLHAVDAAAAARAAADAPTGTATAAGP